MAQIATFVTYTDSKGHAKPALVTATPESITEGTSLPGLNEGQAHLIVFSPSGRTYTKFNVPSAESVQDNEDFRNGDGVLVGVFAN